MLLHVVHETRYEYTPPVETAQHMAHLKPLDLPTQSLRSFRLGIDPVPAQQTETLDVYGNSRTFFSLQAAHETLAVVAESVVSTLPPALPVDNPPWEQVREHFRYHAGAAWNAAAEFAFPSPYVPRHDDFLAYARPSFGAGVPLLLGARHLMERIHAEFTYESESTQVSTPAREALAQRKGVCQDFAHIMIACLRALGLPARYVSGYLLTNPPPGQPRLVGSDASHAWVSVYVPAEDGSGGMWCDLDPTNNRAPGEDYVSLAMGRDYSDVSPMRGVIHGGRRHTLQVAVTVEPLAEPYAAPANNDDQHPEEAA
ncbi:transglutaminase family protein [Ramlibacter sp. H39-3-26]|uniref:transglutaminase family protein n=1 Tax=Curvibacter soli TaxID=3031331 RepID=UPI0023DA0D55|nr:transglutaminase family protein [Ramlibacter sp. H39-3-26]MDF1486541.1 transglutaminase family protein [Ramlibacter sp. H39-3-26]